MQVVSSMEIVFVSRRLWTSSSLLDNLGQHIFQCDEVNYDKSFHWAKTLDTLLNEAMIDERKLADTLEIRFVP